MSEIKHRLGVDEVNLVFRHLKLEDIVVADLETAVNEIDAMYGLDAVSFDEKTSTLNLAYDASRVGLGQVEEILEKHNVVVSHDWWTHFKEGYYKFVDQNVKDNAKHEPWSCHKQNVRAPKLKK